MHATPIHASAAADGGGGLYVLTSADAGLTNPTNSAAELYFTDPVFVSETVRTTCATFGLFPSAATSPADKATHFGFRRIIAPVPATAGSGNVQLWGALDRKPATEGDFSKIRLFAIKTTAGDAYGENFGAARQVQGRWETFASATFTANAGRHVLMAAGGVGNTAGGLRPTAMRLLHQTTAMGHTGHQTTLNRSGSVPMVGTAAFNFFDVLNLGAGANTFEVQWNTSAIGAVSAFADQAAILVMPESSLGGAWVAATDVTAISSAITITTAATLTTALAGGYRFGIFAQARTAIQNNSYSQLTYLYADATQDTRCVLRTGASGGDCPAWSYSPFSAFVGVTASAGTHEYSIQWQTSNVANGAWLAYQRILMVQFDAPAAEGGPVATAVIPLARRFREG
jgi:hypothetical protein